MLENIEVVKVELLDIKDGDVLAVYLKGAFPETGKERIKHEVAAAFLPKVIKVLVLNADVVEMKVIRAE